MDEARGLKETTQPEYQEKADQMSKLRDRRDDCIAQIKQIRSIMQGVDVKSEAELDKKLEELDQAIRSGVGDALLGLVCQQLVIELGTEMWLSGMMEIEAEGDVAYRTALDVLDCFLYRLSQLSNTFVAVNYEAWRSAIGGLQRFSNNLLKSMKPCVSMYTYLILLV